MVDGHEYPCSPWAHGCLKVARLFLCNFVEQFLSESRDMHETAVLEFLCSLLDAIYVCDKGD